MVSLHTKLTVNLINLLISIICVKHRDSFNFNLKTPKSVRRAWLDGGGGRKYRRKGIHRNKAKKRLFENCWGEEELREE